MTASPHLPIRLHIEGWRGISHSYALVNQFQMLHWRRHHHAQIKHSDMPFIMAHWANGHNSAGFTATDLSVIQATEFDGDTDALYRIYAPLNLEAHATLPTLTFAVTELGLSTKDLDSEKVRQYADQGGKIHTPSHWSKRRLVANGIPDGIIHVVGHAVDPTYFYQLSQSQIEENRSNLGFQPEDVVLLNVGTHHWNKGLDLVIKAFALARQRNKHLKLLLKDQRSTYLVNSETYVQQVLLEMGLLEQDLFDSIRMISGHLTLAQLNALYSVADAYVTPYRAEGFNLPALEAQACGTPVIATQGGATDDFLVPATTSAISGALIENSRLKDDLPVNAYVEPSLEQLTQTLQSVARKPHHAVGTRVQSWSEVCQQLNSILLPGTESYRFTAEPSPAQFIIFCDGGIGNRINALVSGLAVAHQLGLTYRIHWPVNNWCAAPFASIFSNTEPISDVSISGLHGRLDNAQMLLHDEIASKVLGVEFQSAYRFESLDDFANQCVTGGKSIFYYPAIMPAWVPEKLIHGELRALQFTAEITTAVRSFIQDVLAGPFYGIHLRRTDLNVGLTDQEVFTLVRQYPDAKFFVCSDDPAAENLASAHPNVYRRTKDHSVEKKVPGEDWLAAKHDDDGRLYYGNIRRSQAAVIEGTIDKLILAHSEIVGYSGSTFQRMARLIGEVAPLIESSKPSPLPYYSLQETKQQLQEGLIPADTVIQIANLTSLAGDPPRATAILQTSIEHFVGAPYLDILHTLGIFCLNQSMHRLACIYLEHVVQSDVSRFSSWIHLAFAQSALGHYGAAKDSFERAIQVQPRTITEADTVVITYLKNQLS
jgi:glycosyltransferase involved in cell wall biosynthesis